MASGAGVNRDSARRMIANFHHATGNYTWDEAFEATYNWDNRTLWAFCRQMEQEFEDAM